LQFYKDKVVEEDDYELDFEDKSDHNISMFGKDAKSQEIVPERGITAKSNIYS
jgi:hypothetical protein